MILIRDNIGINSETIKIIDVERTLIEVNSNKKEKYRTTISFDDYSIEIDENKSEQFNGDFKELIKKIWLEISLKSPTYAILDKLVDKSVDYVLSNNEKVKRETELNHLKCENESLKSQLTFLRGR